MVPRVFRIIFCERLLMPCCLPDAFARTLPVAVNLNRFLALDFVFILGISFSLFRVDYSRVAGHALPDRSQGVVYRRARAPMQAGCGALVDEEHNP